MGRDQNSRFATRVGRLKNRLRVNEMVSGWVKGYTLEVAEILIRHEVPNSPLYNIQDIFEDPHYRTRKNLIEVEDPLIGSVRMQDVVPKFSLTPGKVNSTGPLLGQHNGEVYRSLLGLKEEELERMQQEGII